MSTITATIITPAEARRRAQANRERALQGGRALRPYLTRYADLSPGDGTLCALSDVLTNLMHHAHAAGVDFAGVLEIAGENFHEDLNPCV